MSKYTDFFTAAGTGLYPHTGSAAISGSHHVTGSVDFAYFQPATTAGWSSGGTMATKTSGMAGAGTQTAALAFGGFTGASNVNATEEYNGTVWSPGGNLTIPRRNFGGAGTQTAGLAFGGLGPTGNSNATEEYNGTTWSPGGNLGTLRESLAGAGTQTAGLAFGGSFWRKWPNRKLKCHRRIRRYNMESRR